MQSQTSSIQTADNPIDVLQQLLNLLTDKEREVIVRRFGLRQNNMETLAAIGKDFSVTRERVRQIQSYSLKKLQRNANKTKLKELKGWLTNLLKEHGDIITETKFESQLAIKFPNYKDKLQELKLAAILFDDIDYESNKIHFRPHFRKNEITMGTVKKISNIGRKLLKSFKEPLSHNKLISQIQEQLKADNLNYRKKLILSALKLDRRIKVKSDSISLVAWRHINPKTLYDKILFILRDKKTPLHFTEIANQIIDEQFDDKSVSQQAVHNELINKNDFILVGRGVYALEEWGYKSGTVTDVIRDILSAEGPIEYQNLIDRVLERRKVKAITVQININNKEIFIRDEQDMVSLIAQ